MKSLKYLFALVTLLIISFMIGFFGYKLYDSSIKMEEISKVNSENEIKQDKAVNATREKVSPNATIIIRTYYKKCEHYEEESVELPAEMVNCTQEEIENKYKDLYLESFSANELVFLKKEEGICNNHYILKEKNNVINIYKLKGDEKEEFYDKTSISKEYLSEIDLKKLKEGIEVFGKEELNSILEDYE